MVSRNNIRPALTNVSGLGATILAQSLLPALETADGLVLDNIYLPDIGELSKYRRVTPGRSTVYKRLIPKSASRILECTLLGSYYDGPSTLFVLGDLPIRTAARQIVFIQSPHVVKDSQPDRLLDRVRYRIARSIFRANQHLVSAFVVQTEAMRAELQATYAIEPGRIHVIAQPPPEWLLRLGRRRDQSKRAAGLPLRLFYPAAAYPHKNHGLLAAAARLPGWSALVDTAVLTIAPQDLPGGADSLACVGRLAPPEIAAEYDTTDALLFLSKAESFGFPLVEAMWTGLPIVCADLPYAHALCGETAIYFDPDDAASLHAALETLRRRLDRGWWPDWSDRLALIPTDWPAVASALRDLVAMVERTGGGAPAGHGQTLA